MTQRQRRRPRAMAFTSLISAVAITSSCSIVEGGGEQSGGDGVDFDPARHDGGTYVLAMADNNAFAIAVAAGARQVAAEVNAELIVVDADDDPDLQTEQIRRAAGMGVDGVIVNAVDEGDTGERVQPLVDAGIPIVALNTQIDAPVATYVASDNFDGGIQAAERLARLIGFDGAIIHLEGDPATNVSRERGQGIEEGLRDFPGVVVAARESARFERNLALGLTEDLVLANPDIVGIIAENDEMALGAIEALQVRGGEGTRAGEDIQVVGYGADGPGRGAVTSGTMAATIAVQPEQLGIEGMQQVLLAANGDDTASIVEVGVELVDRESLTAAVEQE